MPTNDVAGRIRQFNHGRRADMLAVKYAKLRKSAWSFFRGTGHLFYAQAQLPAALAAAPVTGLCGDLHLENFGAYRGEHGLACFSVNDFDDTLLGPAAWDLARLAASIFVGVAYLRRPSAEAETLAADCLQAYARDMAAGGPALPDAALLEGPIGALVRAFPDQGAPEALADSAELRHAGQRLKIDDKRFLAVADAERAEVAAQVANFARQQPAGGTLRVLDVARLVSGTSSLGLDRYVVLVEGLAAGRLLELKQASGSCAAPYLNGPQPVWPSEAARVVAGQRVFQAAPPALLGAVAAVSLTGVVRSFVVRAYARASDRFSLDDPGLTETGLAAAVRSMARVAAGGHWRGSTAVGAAGQAALQAFAQDAGWQTTLLDLARALASQSQADYADYCAAYDRGELTSN